MNLQEYKSYYSKYKAKKTTINGITFASKKEAKRFQELRLLERTGHIMDLRLQVPYVLIPKSQHGREIKYVADYVYFDNDLKKEIVEDVKGYKTDVYKLKKRMLAEKYGIEIKET